MGLITQKISRGCDCRNTDNRDNNSNEFTNTPHMKQADIDNYMV